MGNITLSCNVKQMKKALSSFKAVNKEVLFIFKPEGLMIWTVDVSQAMALEMFADKSSFFSYICDAEKIISISVEDFLASLSRFLEDEFLHIYIAENGNEVRASIVKREQKNIVSNRQFYLPIVMQTLQYKDYKFNHDNVVKITSLLWKTAVMDMGVNEKDYSGGFLVFISKDKIRFQKGETGTTKSKVEYHRSKLREIALTEDNVTLDLSLHYIYNFFKTLPDDLLLEFRFKKDKPFICRFDISDAKLSTLESSQPFKFKLIFAPFIKKEEDGVEFKEETDGFGVGDSIDVPALDEIEDKNKIKEKKDEEGLKLD